MQVCICSIWIIPQNVGLAVLSVCSEENLSSHQHKELFELLGEEEEEEEEKEKEKKGGLARLLSRMLYPFNDAAPSSSLSFSSSSSSSFSFYPSLSSGSPLFS